jgi:glycosyltransferase involved in cell wall biosynthesis
MGRVLGWKGIHLGVRAFARLLERYPDAEYWHDGGGELAEELKRLAVELKLGDKFKLFESNTRQQALENLAQSDVLVFPNLHNESGWVCYEAMAARRPVIYLLGRLPFPNAEKSSFVANAETVEGAIQDMANAMYRMATEPELRLQMGEEARTHTWEYYNVEVRGRYYAQMFEQLAEHQRR